MQEVVVPLKPIGLSCKGWIGWRRQINEKLTFIKKGLTGIVDKSNGYGSDRKIL
jgi:hypothetical protein